MTMHTNPVPAASSSSSKTSSHVITSPSSRHLATQSSGGSLHIPGPWKSIPTPIALPIPGSTPSVTSGSNIRLLKDLVTRYELEVSDSDSYHEGETISYTKSAARQPTSSSVFLPGPSRLPFFKRPVPLSPPAQERSSVQSLLSSSSKHAQGSFKTLGSSDVVKSRRKESNPVEVIQVRSSPPLSPPVNRRWRPWETVAQLASDTTSTFPFGMGDDTAQLPRTAPKADTARSAVLSPTRTSPTTRRPAFSYSSYLPATPLAVKVATSTSSVESGPASKPPLLYRGNRSDVLDNEPRPNARSPPVRVPKHSVLHEKPRDESFPFPEAPSTPFTRQIQPVVARMRPRRLTPRPEAIPTPSSHPATPPPSLPVSTSPEPSTSLGFPKVYLQEACLRHKFIRSRDKSNVFERPERIRATHVGVAAAYALLEFAMHEGSASEDGSARSSRSSQTPSRPPFDLIRSMATLDILEHPAAAHIHAMEDDYPTSYGGYLRTWCDESKARISKGKSEIPDEYEQDLYLCPESLTAFEGALGTVCEAVDAVMRVRPAGVRSKQPCSLDSRAFVVIRPPGHHCAEDMPMGFGFVNNVAVGAIHASQNHQIRRVVIFDYDLHHGNGTQTIVRNINDRMKERGGQLDDTEPLICYGSMHDILSYPCEDDHESGMAQDASLSLHGVDGNWIENIHLESYATEKQFWEQYDRLYSKLFSTATKFIESTGGAGTDDVLVFISCGFDASEHETEDMSRHGRKVPTAFYHRFTRDACRFAEKYASGRLISVLEGGYSDMALTSGAMAHVTALADTAGVTDQDWWSMKRLVELEKATKKRRGRPARADTLDGWIRRTCEIFETLEAPSTSEVSASIVLPRLTEEIRQSMSESSRKQALKRPQVQTGIQTRAKRAKTSTDPKRMYLESSIESDSDEVPIMASSQTFAAAQAKREHRRPQPAMAEDKKAKLEIMAQA